MSFMGLLPSLPAMFGAYGALKLRQTQNPTDLSVPNYASTEVLLAQEKTRRKAQSRLNRRATDLTGGLTGSPTLGAASLWAL